VNPEQGSETVRAGQAMRWLRTPAGEFSGVRLAAALLLAALAAAALAALLDSLFGLGSAWTIILTAVLSAAFILGLVVQPLVHAYARRLDTAESEIADTVQRLRAAKAQQQGGITDVLTHLPNKRALTSSLLEHMAHAERYGNPLSVAYVRLDDFEQLDSRYGAHASEQALRTMAEVFNETLRMPDKAGRCDGDEFLVVLPHTKLKDANGIIARLRSNVAARRLRHGDLDVSLAVTTGVTQFRKGDDLEQLLTRTRNALAGKPAARRRSPGKKAARPA
jgi:diguanylate cyclase (GGDEF)-like protein